MGSEMCIRDRIDNGQLQIVSANRKSFQPKVTYRVAAGGTWAPPVLLNEGVLVKDKDTLTLWSLASATSGAR